MKACDKYEIHTRSFDDIDYSAYSNCGLIVDPPWDLELFPPKLENMLVFCDGFRARSVIDRYGSPLWIFTWDCVSSWWSQNRPLRRSKLCLWYGDSPMFDQESSRVFRVGRDVNARLVRNTRGSYTYTPSVNGVMLSDVYTEPITGMSKSHKHEKPIQWISALIGGCFSCVDTVLDPFCGSGAFGVASISKGKRYIGSDIDRRWAEHTMRRIDDYISNPHGSRLACQLSMFNKKGRKV